MAVMLSPSEALQRDFEFAPAPADDTAAERTDAPQRRYGVRLAEYGLLLPRATICEIAEELPDCALPNTPAWFAGVLNQRGTIVPVFDIAAMLDIAQNAVARRWVLIVGTRDEAVGLRVQALPQTVYINPGEALAYNPVNQTMLEPFVSAAFNGDDTLWLEWDLDGFFTAAGETLGSG